MFIYQCFEWLYNAAFRLKYLIKKCSKKTGFLFHCHWVILGVIIVVGWCMMTSLGVKQEHPNTPNMYHLKYQINLINASLLSLNLGITFRIVLPFVEYIQLLCWLLSRPEYSIVYYVEYENELCISISPFSLLSLSFYLSPHPHPQGDTDSPSTWKKRNWTFF